MAANPAPSRWCREPVVSTTVQGLPAQAVAAVPGVGPSVDIAGVSTGEGWCHSADVAFQGSADWEGVPYELVAYVGSVWVPLVTGVLGDVQTNRVGGLASTLAGSLPPIRGRAFTRLLVRLYPPVLATPLPQAVFSVVAWGGDSPGVSSDQAGPQPVDLFSRPSQRWSEVVLSPGAVIQRTLRPANPRGGRLAVTGINLSVTGTFPAGSTLTVRGILGPVREEVAAFDLDAVAVAGVASQNFAAPAFVLPGMELEAIWNGGADGTNLGHLNVHGFDE